MNTKQTEENEKHLYVLDIELNIDNGKVRTDCENKFS